MGTNTNLSTRRRTSTMPNNTAEAREDILLPSRMHTKTTSSVAKQEMLGAPGSEDTTLEPVHGPGPMEAHSATRIGPHMSPTMLAKAVKIASDSGAMAHGMTSLAHATCSPSSASTSAMSQQKQTPSNHKGSPKLTPTDTRQQQSICTTGWEHTTCPPLHGRHSTANHKSMLSSTGKIRAGATRRVPS